MTVNPARAWCSQSSIFYIKHSKIPAGFLKPWQDVCPCGGSRCICTAFKSSPANSPALIWFAGSQVSLQVTQRDPAKSFGPGAAGVASGCTCSSCRGVLYPLNKLFWSSRFTADFINQLWFKALSFLCTMKTCSGLLPNTSRERNLDLVEADEADPWREQDHAPG